MWINEVNNKKKQNKTSKIIKVDESKLIKCLDINFWVLRDAVVILSSKPMNISSYFKSI